MKNTYVTAELKLVSLESSDIITTSGAFNGEEDKIKDKEVNTPLIKF